MHLKLDAKTAARVKLAANKTEDFAWSDELEGFGLRLRQRRDGSLLRTWTAQYRSDGHTRRFSFGSVERVTFAEAKAAARKILASVTLGYDPQAEKATKRRRAARTFRAVVDAYLAARQGDVASGIAAAGQALFDRALFPIAAHHERYGHHPRRCRRVFVVRRQAPQRAHCWRGPAYGV